MDITLNVSVYRCEGKTLTRDVNISFYFGNLLSSFTVIFFLLFLKFYLRIFPFSHYRMDVSFECVDATCKHHGRTGCRFQKKISTQEIKL